MEEQKQSSSVISH